MVSVDSHTHTVDLYRCIISLINSVCTNTMNIYCHYEREIDMCELTHKPSDKENCTHTLKLWYVCFAN